MSSKIEEEKKMQENEKKKKLKDKKKEEQELSEEDKLLKEKIDTYVQRIMDTNEQVAQDALLQLKNEVKLSTTSMTSVPKPFKFLKPHYTGMVEFYDKVEPGHFKKLLADFLSVISITMAETGQQICLKFLQQGTKKDFIQQGYEYLLTLATDIGEEYNIRLEENCGYDDLLELTKQMIPYFMENNAEPDAIDLAMKIDTPEILIQYVNSQNFQRVVSYLAQCALYSVDQEEMEKILNTGYEISMNLQQYTSALRLAIKLDNQEMIEKVFKECKDPLLAKQICFQIARQRINIPDLDQDCKAIAYNEKLSDFYIKFAKELEVVEAKSPDQVYKASLEIKVNLLNNNLSEIAIQNLANTYVNAFVNCGAKQDVYMLNHAGAQNDDQKLYLQQKKHLDCLKDDHKIAGIASIGLVDLWDQSQGLNDIESYMELEDGFFMMGAMIAVGLCNTGVQTEADPAKAILLSDLATKGPFTKKGSIIGLGLAYAGSARQDLIEDLIPIVVDLDQPLDLCAYCALTMGLIFVGKCDDNVGNALIQTLSERAADTQKNQLNDPISLFFVVAIGLLYMGQQEKCELILEAIKIVNHPITKYAENTIIGCAYVGSGNVLKIQDLLQQCTEQLSEKDCLHQQAAVMSIALIASSEDIGNEMANRTLNHILQYGNIELKRSVPLALALLNISNPKINVMDSLVKLSHDSDIQLSQRAMFALGIIGAGTNNSRLAEILRNIALYYTKESNDLYIVRLVQGLLHMGKGMVTIQPYYSDRFLLSKVGMAGILIIMNSCLKMSDLIYGKYHYNLFYLALSIYPKMMFCLNENLENQSINVRVGQAVDTVGQAGKPKKITGFQTHTSPVVINYGERAELGTEEYIPIQEIVLENFVILKKNPDYVPEEEKRKKKLSL